MGGTFGGLERLFQQGDALCFDFQLLVQRSVLGSQGLQFRCHLSQTLSLQERGREPLVECSRFRVLGSG